MVERIRLVRDRSSVLATDEFAEARRSIKKCLKPRNTIARIYCDDFAHDNWKAKQLRQLEKSIVRRNLPDALFSLLRQIGVENAVALVEGWCTGESKATAEV